MKSFDQQACARLPFESNRTARDGTGW